MDVFVVIRSVLVLLIPGLSKPFSLLTEVGTLECRGAFILLFTPLVSSSEQGLQECHYASKFLPVQVPILSLLPLEQAVAE